MNPYESPVPEARMKAATCPARSWLFAKWLGTIAFLTAGSGVFYLGFRAFNPPPPPPGTALCGNSVFGGLFLMVCGAPIVAIIASFLGAVVGGIVDCILRLRAGV